jgi:hypothetical protein
MTSYCEFENKTILSSQGKTLYSKIQGYNTSLKIPKVKSQAVNRRSSCSTSDPRRVFIPVTTFNVTDYKTGKYSHKKAHIACTGDPQKTEITKVRINHH